MENIPRLDYRVVTELLSSLPSARALTVWILIRHGEFEQAISLSFNPLDYNDVEEARFALLATELLRKNEDLPTNIDKDSVAFLAFEKAEEQCRLTNERLRSRNDFGPEISSAIRKISDILGEFDPEEMLELAAWGPGSTLKIKRRNSSSANKFRQEAELTPALFALLKPWFRSQFPHWDTKFHVYEGNKVITVPKNAKTNRVIAVEPSLNLFFQKGVGSMIRKRLRRFGVDLNTQKRNQELCATGSKTGRLATVDFSSASDTISSFLVLDLLPFKWFQVLDVLRSPRGLYRDSLIEYNKFSSMGNGFTFELESLIFLALALSCVPEDHPDRAFVTVFGDDVIIPSDCYERYRDLCSFCGFTINDKKSYHQSYYRESCGVHFWNGYDITPIYNRRYLIKDETMRFHNRMVELSRRTIGDGFRDKRFRHVIEILANASEVKLQAPAGYGDLGLITDFDVARPVYDRSYQRGFRAKALITRTRGVYEDDDSLRVSKLYHLWKLGDAMSDLSEGNLVTYSSRRSLRTKVLWYPDWPCLGPWV